MPEFPLALFRTLYPQFAAVSDEVVLATAQMALCFTSERGCSCSEQMWILMVAHMLQLAANAAAGNGAIGQLSGASIDKVSVSFAMPPATTSWAYWLNGTPFGQQFAALMNRCQAGGMYVGGRGERAGFRVVGGGFPRPRRF
jgi:hypothetical protein